MIFLRSILFQVLFYASTILVMFVLLLMMPFVARRVLWDRFIMLWVRLVLLLLRFVVGMKVEITGRENIPEGPLLVVSKHQSAWETIALLPLFSDPVFILKRELMSMPMFGRFLAKAEMIPIDRGAKSTALRGMTDAALEKIAQGRQILIFPEGTRRPPGAPPAYKFGVAHLYTTLKVPCVPIALNSGLFWPRGQLIRRPGTVRVEILPVIPVGLPRGAFLRRMQNDIETASERLLQEGLQELGPNAPKIDRGEPAAEDGLSP
ncbi:lysophospholipid acyltransferase family protein [Xanthobacter sp. DSM 24535]|uniref:lysophospholipid acyltransferase family protein n=1 Tax=Roseixanthobacter psychrophilus TaxID=3119917 RepID=UPI00372B1C89